MKLSIPRPHRLRRRQGEGDIRLGIGHQSFLALGQKVSNGMPGKGVSWPHHCFSKERKSLTDIDIRQEGWVHEGVYRFWLGGMRRWLGNGVKWRVVEK